MNYRYYVYKWWIDYGLSTALCEGQLNSMEARFDKHTFPVHLGGPYLEELIFPN